MSKYTATVAIAAIGFYTCNPVLLIGSSVLFFAMWEAQRGHRE